MSNLSSIKQDDKSDQEMFIKVRLTLRRLETGSKGISLKLTLASIQMAAFTEQFVCMWKSANEKRETTMKFEATFFTNKNMLTSPFTFLVLLFHKALQSFPLQMHSNSNW